MSNVSEWTHFSTLGNLPDEPIDLAAVRSRRKRDGWILESTWEVIRGRIEPVKLTFEPPKGRSISTDELRRLPLGAVLAEVRSEVVSQAGLVAQFAEVVAGMDKPGPHKGRRMGDDELQKVADVYRAAHAVGRPVNEAVREVFDLTKDGAAKRIMAARRAGLLDGVGPKR